MKKNYLQLLSITLVGVIVGRAFRYLLNVIIAQSLGPAALGVFATGLVVTKVGSVFGRLGLDNAGQKYIPRYIEQDEHERVSGVVLSSLSLTLISSSLVAFLFYSLSVNLGFNVFPSASILMIFSLAIPLYAVMSVGMSVTRGFKETKYAVLIRDVGQSVSGIILLYTGILLFNSIEAAAIGYLLSLAVGSALAVAFLFLLLRNRASFMPDFEINKILTYSLPLLIVAVMNQLMSWVDIIMLNILRSSATVGKYQAVFQTAAILGVILQASNSIFPVIASDLYSSGQKQELQVSYEVTTKWMAYLSLIGFVLLALFPRDFLSIFGQQFLDTQLSLIVLAAGQLVFVTFGPAAAVLVMSEYERVELINSAIASVLNIFLNFTLIQQYGVTGAAVATAVSMAVLVVIRTTEVWWLMKIHPLSYKYWKGIIAVGATVPALVLVRTFTIFPLFRLLIAGVVAVLIFGIVIWGLGLDETDKVLLDSV